MRLLTVLVAAVSAIMLALWHQKPDDIPLYVPVSGLILAGIIWKSAQISIFLRTFIGMYAAGFLLIAITSTLRAFEMLPVALAPFLAPAFMATASAVFAAIVYGVSHIGVIRTITRIADPYFLSVTPVGNAFAGFGRLFGTEGRAAVAMLCVIIAGNFVQVALTIRLNLWYRDLFDALEKKDASIFWYQIWLVFVPLLVVWIIFQMIDLITDEFFHIRWRTFLTERYFDRWLSDATHYRMSLEQGATDNPDQRIAVDVNSYLRQTMALSVRLLTQAATLVSFTVILWGLSRGFTFPGTDYVVPGFLVWVALAYAFVGTLLTHVIGRPLIKLDFMQERVEASFRFSLARLREYAEQVALLQGGPNERAALRLGFGDVVRNFVQIVVRRLKLTGFTFSWSQMSVAFPYILMGPYYFAQKITLGQLQQGGSAFGRVETALSFFISSYQSLASYKATLDRLSTFDEAMARAEGRGRQEPGPAAASPPTSTVIQLSNVKLQLPTGRTIVSAEALAFGQGKRTLLTGPSGSGKSTLFRALAGVWPYVEGKIAVPAEAHVMLLPQRPYLPQGSLRKAVCYPQDAAIFSDAVIAAALNAVKLEGLSGSLDEDDNWQQRLSGGEQQRLAMARALLARPDWLLLDECTSALDEPNEASIYETLRVMLPQTTVISIGHRSTLAAFHDVRVELQSNGAGAFVPKVL